MSVGRPRVFVEPTKPLLVHIPASLLQDCKFMAGMYALPLNLFVALCIWNKSDWGADMNFNNIFLKDAQKAFPDCFNSESQ